jgi:hypothetical protein
LLIASPVLVRLIYAFTTLEYEDNPEGAKYFVEKPLLEFLAVPNSIKIVDAICYLSDDFAAPMRSGLHLRNVEYDNTLAVLYAWSDPCRFGKKW